MRVFRLAVAIVLLGAATALRADAEPSAWKAGTKRPSERAVRAAVERLPLAFEVNRGQAPAGWDFLVRCRGYHAFVASTGIVFSFDGDGLAMSIEGGECREPVTAGGELPGRVNYFLGNDSSKWLSNVPLVSGARYAGVTPRTAWNVGGRGRALEFAFELEPGADTPRLRFDGAKSLRLDARGALRAEMANGVATISAPVAWQDAGGVRRDAHARFVLSSDGTVEIGVAPQDPGVAVHVDPTVTYESYLGASDTEVTGGAAMDASGAPYLVGHTASTGFPTTGGAYSQTKQQDPQSATVRTDAFVTKLNSSGSALVYSTFIGSRSDEVMRGIRVDASGNAYISGDAYYSDYPVTAGTYSTTAPSTSGAMGVLTELNSSGSGLVFSTYVQYRSWGLALGTSGSVYVLEGQGLSLYTAGGATRAFHTAIDPATTIGNQSMVLTAVASDSNGDAYVTGYTSKTNYPLTSGAYQTTISGQVDGFVTKITSSGAVSYATLVGGSSHDWPRSIDVNWNGQAFITGATFSSNYPTTSGAYRTTRAASSDGFLTRLDATGTALKFSTYLGGSGTDAQCVRVHPSGACYVGGIVGDSNFPTSNAFQSSIGGAQDGFILKFNPESTLAWSSFCGGTLDDYVAAIGVGPDGTIVAEGQTYSTNLPTTNPYQGSNIGAGDVFFLQIPDTLPTVLTTPTLGAAPLGDWTVSMPYAQQVTPTGGLAPYTFTVTSGGTAPGLNLASGGLLSGTPLQTGSFSATVRVDDAAEKTSTGTVTIHINELPAIPSQTMQGWTIDVPVSQSIVTTGGTAPLTFTKLAGSAPTGTSLDAAGIVVGTPTELGTFLFTAECTDAAGAKVSSAMSFRVNSPPSVDALTPPACTSTRPYTFQFETTGGTAPFGWAVVGGSAPASLRSDTGAFAGPAFAAGSYSFNVRATDAAGVKAERSFEVTVNPFPQISTSSLATSAAGRAYSAHVAVSGGTPPFTWSVPAHELPSGMQFDTATGQLSGVVTGSGVHPVVFECTDAWGAVATASLTVDAAAGVNLSRRGLTEKAPLGSTHGQYLTRYLELTAGTSLTVTMSGGGANKTRPQLALVDSAGAPADIAAWTKSTANSVRLKSFPVPRTGRWFLRATAAPGYAGKVKLSYSISPRTVWTSSATAGPATSPEYAFSAPPGARLSIVAQSPKGSSALPRIVAVVAPDGSDLLPGGVVSESGTKATFTTKTPLAGGDHQVRFAARDANEGPISWTVRLRLPKSYTFAMPEVAAGE